MKIILHSLKLPTKEQNQAVLAFLFAINYEWANSVYGVVLRDKSLVTPKFYNSLIGIDISRKE